MNTRDYSKVVQLEKELLEKLKQGKSGDIKTELEKFPASPKGNKYLNCNIVIEPQLTIPWETETETDLKVQTPQITYKAFDKEFTLEPMVVALQNIRDLKNNMVIADVTINGILHKEKRLAVANRDGKLGIQVPVFHWKYKINYDGAFIDENNKSHYIEDSLEYTITNNIFLSNDIKSGQVIWIESNKIKAK